MSVVAVRCEVGHRGAQWLGLWPLAYGAENLSSPRICSGPQELVVEPLANYSLRFISWLVSVSCLKKA